MNKEEGIKLNNAFDEFCQNFNIKSAIGDAVSITDIACSLFWTRSVISEN